MRLVLRIWGRILRVHERFCGAVALAGAAGVSCASSVQSGYGLRARTAFGGKIEIGSRTTLDRWVDLFAREGTLSIGPNCHIGKGCVIVARGVITIGPGCQIAEHVTIRDQDHRVAADRTLSENEFDVAPVSIGSNVWIGAGAVVTKGVTIGDGAVIGAGAVVTRDISEGARAVGVPARELRTT